MNSIPQTSFRHRQAMLAAAVAVLVTASTALAQSGGAGSTSYGSSQKNPPADTDTTATTGSASSRDTQRTQSSSTDTTRGTTGTYGTGTSTADPTATNTTPGAPTGRETRMTTSERLSWGDRRFVTKAADSGIEEVHVAKLAAEKANSPEVRNFAQKIVESHGVVNSELTSLAGQKNVKLDTDDDKPRAYNRLNRKSGSDFDQEFVEHMIDEHEKDIKMYEKAAKDAKDADIRSFASKHVSHLREHLQTAQRLQQSIVPTGRMEDTTRATDTTGTTSPTTSTTGSRTYGTAAGTTDTTRSSTDTAGTYGTSTTDTTRGTTGTTGTGTTATDTTSTTVGAPTGRDTRMTTTERLSWGDRRFVTKAADSGMDEIEVARLAAEKASNPEVRNFAQKVVKDHGMVNSELTSLAGQKNVKLDAEGDKPRAYKRLAKKSGSDFDQEFVEHMIDEHEKDIKMFEKAAKDAKDADIRSFASKHVSHLREHLQTAQRLQQSVTPTGRTSQDATRATGTYDAATSGTTGTTGTQDTTRRPSSTDDPSRPGTTDSSTSPTPKRDRSR